MLSTALFATLWLLLSGGDPASWVIGLPSIAAAVWASRKLGTVDSGRLSMTSLASFIPFFLWESMRGGFDVLVRVMRPQMRIDPGFRPYEIRLQDKRARLLFVNSVSLLPGTLAADLDQSSLNVHALDVSTDFTTELQRLERAVGRVFEEEAIADDR